MFLYNTQRFDFSSIEDAIRRFYPIGISRDEGAAYFQFSGVKDLERIVVENVHHVDRFNQNWVSFCNEIETEFKKPVISTTYGQAPSFSAYLLLESATHANLTRSKELHFFVSLLGPFYTVLGLDNNKVTLSDQQHFISTNYIVLSPENEFAEPFRVVCDLIESRFSSFRFVPSAICQQAIPGLWVRYSDSSTNTVFNALFNDQVDDSIPRSIGNRTYKLEQWLKDGIEENGDEWTVYHPNS